MTDDVAKATSAIRALYKARKKHESFSLGELAEKLKTNEEKSRSVASELIDSGVLREHHIFRGEYILTAEGRSLV